MKTKLIFISMFLCFFLASCSTEDTESFEELKADRESVATMVTENELEITENGIITLPEEYSSVSDTGEACLVLFDDEPAIYFWAFRGGMGDSKGYVYMLDIKDEEILDKCSERFEFVNVENLGDGWYSVSTSDD